MLSACSRKGFCFPLLLHFLLMLVQFGRIQWTVCRLGWKPTAFSYGLCRKTGLRRTVPGNMSWWIDVPPETSFEDHLKILKIFKVLICPWQLKASPVQLRQRFWLYLCRLHAVLPCLPACPSMSHRSIYSYRRKLCSKDVELLASLRSQMGLRTCHWTKLAFKNTIQSRHGEHRKQIMQVLVAFSMIIFYAEVVRACQRSCHICDEV